jgi:hypothetical protein
LGAPGHVSCRCLSCWQITWCSGPPTFPSQRRHISLWWR